MKRHLIVLTIIFMVCLTQSAFAQNSFRLGFVKGPADGTDSIWLAKTKKKDRVDSKAIAILGHTTGLISINGRDINLRLSREHLPDRSFKVGRGGYQIWKGKSIVVRLDYIFTWLCPPKDEQCEVYHYKGVMDISYKGKRRTVKITGFGGS